MNTNPISHSFAALLILAGAAMSAGANDNPAEPALKDVFKDSFLIGAALNDSQFSERDPVQTALIKKHFNTITPENVMKWALIHPQPDAYDFGPADRYVEFGEKNNMFIIGHTLVWHSQTPRWVFEGPDGKPADRDTLIKRMRDHIHAVAGRYKGRVKGWDVVNEALNEDGSLRQSPWLRIIGEDYLEKAFQYAHEADPDAELYYNDYSLENEPKRNGAVTLVSKLKAKGLRVDGIGTQHHNQMKWPSTKLVEDTILAFSKLGVKVMITELDIDVLPTASGSQSADVSMNFALRASLNPYTNGLPESVQSELAQRYADLFKVFLKHQDKISRVTFWGVTDGDSWLNDWPVRGRTSYPLLFDRDGEPKSAFHAVVKAAREHGSK